MRPKQQREPLNSHPVPPLPWNKVGTDLFEHAGNHYLILVDYYSNFIEVVPLPHDTKSETVIKQIKMNIARYGIMDTLVSDNGPQFSSSQFAKFTNSYGINHVTSSPTYPQSNGLAEKAVQTVKKLITKCNASGDDVYLALLELRNSPRDDITGSPMQRLHGRRAQTRLPIAESRLIPTQSKPAEIHEKLMEYRKKQSYYHNRNSKSLKPITPSDAIRVWTPEGWKPAELVGKHILPNSYIIKAGTQGRIYRRNRKDLMITNENPHINGTPQHPNNPMDTPQRQDYPDMRRPTGRTTTPMPPNNTQELEMSTPEPQDTTPEPDNNIPNTQNNETHEQRTSQPHDHYQRPPTPRRSLTPQHPARTNPVIRPRRLTKPPAWMQDYVSEK
jgi:transposase InsO family protein